MARSQETEIRALLRALTAAGFEPNPACENPVCQAMAPVEARVAPAAARKRQAIAAAPSNGGHGA